MLRLVKAREQGDERDDEQARAEADLQVAAGPERAKAGSAAQPAPATRDRLARRGVVERGQEQQVAALVEAEDGEIDLLRRQQIDQLRDAEREDRRPCGLEPPRRQDMVHVRRAHRRPAIVEIGIEIVVRDHEHAFVGISLIVRFQLGVGLKPQRRLAAPLLAEYQGRRRIGRTAKKLVPGRMVDRRQTPPLEDGIRLSILLAERIAR